MKIVAVGMLVLALLGIFFVPDAWFLTIISEREEKKELVSNLLTVVTFLCGFILLILPMKVDGSNQPTPVRQRLQKCLVERNRFLMVLFLLFLIAIFMLLLAYYVNNVWFFKILLFILVTIFVSVIRLFFIIKEYIEYTE